MTAPGTFYEAIIIQYPPIEIFNRDVQCFILEDIFEIIGLLISIHPLRIRSGKRCLVEFMGYFLGSSVLIPIQCKKSKIPQPMSGN